MNEGAREDMMFQLLVHRFAAYRNPDDQRTQRSPGKWNPEICQAFGLAIEGQAVLEFLAQAPGEQAFIGYATGN